MNNLTLVEKALSEGRLFCAMANGNYWRCRRNGRTKLWKTRSGEFRIPIKAGFRTCGYVTHRSEIGMGCCFEIREVE